MKSYNNILNKIAQFANAHIQVKKIDFDFLEQMGNKMTVDNKWPILYVVPIQNTATQNQYNYIVDVYCLDYIQQGRQNINDLVSDCDLILKDLHRWFVDDPTNYDYEVNNTPNILPINNYLLDYVAGAVLRLEISTDVSSVCDIPFAFNPDEPIPACPDVFYELKNTLDEILGSGQLFGGTTTIIAPDATVTFNGLPLATIPSNDTIDISCNTTINQIVTTQVNNFDLQYLQGIYALGTDIVNGKNVYKYDDGINGYRIEWSGTEWQIFDANNPGIILASAVGGTQQPWDADWSAFGIEMNISSISDICCGIQAPLFNRLPTKSGANISYAAGDDAADQRARETSFFILSEPNIYGHNFRFVGRTGGYHDRTDNTFRDKNGNTTTKALAFPDNLMIDLAYTNGNENFGQAMMWYYNTVNLISNLRSWNGLLPYINTLVYAGLANWKMPNKLEFTVIEFAGNNTTNTLNYEPFLTASNDLYWLNVTDPDDTNKALRMRMNTLLGQTIFKTNEGGSTKLLTVRYATYTKVGNDYIWT